ncbi:hypothetical protein HanPSC8_Chr12g0534871 [Helianthus annuus]|nr:hypothetical protein HanPSC8_Chr12g0534871 [Helianthus annuus]
MAQVYTMPWLQEQLPEPSLYGIRLVVAEVVLADPQGTHQEIPSPQEYLRVSVPQPSYL